MKTLNELRDKKIKEAQEVFTQLNLSKDFSTFNNFSKQEANMHQPPLMLFTRLSSSSNHILIIENA